LAEELADDDVVEMANRCGRRRSDRCRQQPAGSAFVRQLSPPVIDWVSRNKDALLAFWYHRDTWTEPEVNNFIQRLQRR